MEEISAAQVRAIAALTRVKLTDGEVDVMRGQLSAILGHFASLAQVDTVGVEPTAHTNETDSVFREDVPVPPMPREQVLANAPDSEGEFIRVRPVLE